MLKTVFKFLEFSLKTPAKFKLPKLKFFRKIKMPRLQDAADDVVFIKREG